MNSSKMELVPMGLHMLVRERPNGAVLHGRQTSELMSFFGCNLRIGDWVVERADSGQRDEDLMVVRQAEFDRAWEIVGVHPEEDLPC